MCGDGMVLDDTNRNSHGQVLTTGRVESEGEVDFYWTEEATRDDNGTGKPRSLLIGLQGEQGFGSFVALAGVCGKRKPVAKIMSKLHAVEAFNTVPEPLCPSWLLYEVGDDKLVLRLTHWFPLSADPHGNPHAWLYSYPVIRDTLKILLRNYNIDNMNFLTTNGLSKFIDKDAEGFVKMNGGDLILYDFAKEEPLGEDSERLLDGDLVITTPCWGFPYVFALMGGCLSVVVCAAVDESNDMLNQSAIDTLTTYCEQAFDLEIDVEKQKEVTDVLLSVGEEIEAEDTRMLKRVADSRKRNEDVGGMFG